MSIGGTAACARPARLRRNAKRNICVLYTQAPEGPATVRCIMGYVKCWTMALSVLFTTSCSAPTPPQQNTYFDQLYQSIDNTSESQATADENAAKTRIDNYA